MTAPTSTWTVPIPERIWFANTDMMSFFKVPREPGETSAFTYWLDAGRLFVTPDEDWPTKYTKRLTKMQPGDPVLAYEDRVGFVALGRVCDPKDLRSSREDTKLYPQPTADVQSVAVDWDTSVHRATEEVASHVKRVASWALQDCDPKSQLGRYMLGILQAKHDSHAADPDASEASAVKRIRSSPAYGPKMKAHLIQARVGQGLFRAGVLAREPACRVTGITQQRCLVASHIKPWAVCVGNEHLDGANGLMLAPHIDHLFDTGRISFTDDGHMLLAPTLDRGILQAWYIDETMNVGRFSSDQARYLDYHRMYVFGQPRPRRQRNLVGDALDGGAYFDGFQHAVDAAVETD